MSLPIGWVETTIGRSGATLRTGPFGSAVHKQDYVIGGVPLINPMHIKGGRIRASANVTVSPAKADQLADFYLRPGDVILGRRGEMGRCAVVEPSQANWLIGTGSMALGPGEALHPPFLQKWLSSGPVIAALEGAAVGSTMVNLNQSALNSLNILLPPVAEQHRIVAKLDALTARLARSRRELDRLPILAEKLRQAALAHARCSVSDAPRVAVSELSATTFDGPFGSNLKSADYSSDGVRVIRLENIGHLQFNEDRKTYISEVKYAQLTRHTLQPRDILFSSFVDQQVRVCRLPANAGLAINKADCFAVRVSENGVDSRFVTYMLASAETYEAMKAKVHGATRPRIGLSHLREYKIPLPALENQRGIANRLDAAFARADRLEAQASRARALLDRLEAAILAKAFRGELVPQDPNDEPASVLLDRIRAERAATPKPKRGRARKAVG